MPVPAAVGPTLCGSRSLAGIALCASLLSVCAALVRLPQPVQHWSTGQRPVELTDEVAWHPSSFTSWQPRVARHVLTSLPAEVPPPPPGAPPPPLSEAHGSDGALASRQRTCEAWCEPRYNASHCQTSKCRWCGFCRPSPPTPALSATTPMPPWHEEQRPRSDGAPPKHGDASQPTQGDGAPPPTQEGNAPRGEGGGSELQRPESECLGSAEDDGPSRGPPSFDLVALTYTDDVNIGITASTQRPNRTKGLIGT